MPTIIPLFKLLEEFQILVFWALTITSVVVWGHSLSTMDVITGKIFISSSHPVINA